MNSDTMDDVTKQILQEIGFPVYKSGYRRLRAAVIYFAPDPEQSLHKELYPRVSDDFSCSAPSVEASIRRVIQWTWKYGNKAAWHKYFPGITKAPTNQAFLGTLAEYLLQKKTPPSREGQ